MPPLCFVSRLSLSHFRIPRSEKQCFSSYAALLRTAQPTADPLGKEPGQRLFSSIFLLIITITIVQISFAFCLKCKDALSFNTKLWNKRSHKGLFHQQNPYILRSWVQCFVNIFFISKKWCQGDSSDVKNICSFFKGPQFSSQYLCLVSHNCLASTYNYTHVSCTQTYIDTHTYDMKN